MWKAPWPDAIVYMQASRLILSEIMAVLDRASGNLSVSQSVRVTRGFAGRGSGSDQSDRIPPGQHLVEEFTVLTAGPAPSVEPSDWKFTVKVGPKLGFSRTGSRGGLRCPCFDTSGAARHCRLPRRLQRQQQRRSRLWWESGLSLRRRRSGSVRLSGSLLMFSLARGASPSGPLPQWESSEPRVLPIDRAGMATAIAPGNAFVRVGAPLRK